jgi:hypothetical protein
MDIYKQYINKNADDKTTVNVDVFQGCSFIDCCYYGNSWAVLISISIYTRIYWCGESWYFSGIHIGIVLEKNI